MNVLGLLKSNYAVSNNMNKLKSGITDSNARLSTGHNLDKDNPSNILKISRLNSELIGSQAGQKNIQDGVSFIQTADSALSSVSDMGQRLKELSVEYNNNSTCADDKATIEKEAQALAKEIGHVMKNSSYNGKNVFNQPNVAIQAGDKSTDKVNIEIPNFKTTGAFTGATEKTISNTNSSIEDAVSSAKELANSLASQGAKGEASTTNNSTSNSVNSTINSSIITTTTTNTSTNTNTNSTVNSNNTTVNSGNTINTTNITVNVNNSTKATNSNGTDGKELAECTPPLDFSIKDIDKYNIKNILKSDFIEKNILNPVAKARSEFAVKEKVLDFRLSYLQNQEDIKSSALSRIQDVDFAKEMMNKAKYEMLLNTNLSVFSQTIDMSHSMVQMLLK